MTKTLAKKKILIISHDKIGTSMAGPGIRYHYMGQVLSSDFDVTIGFFDPTYLPDEHFEHSYQTRSINANDFAKDFADFEIVIALWLNKQMISFCNDRNIFIAFDLYAPVPVENLAGSIYSGKPVREDDDFEFSQSLAMYRLFFENGDLFLCSNQRQLDFWIGYIFGADQIRPSDYEKRPIYDRFIYAPMGIDSGVELKHTGEVIRNVLPGVTKEDKVLVWTGGIWGHFDGTVLMKAMKLLRAKRPDIKLVFFGTQHPNPNIPEMKESLTTRKLAEDFGLLNETVFFKDGWVDYPDRINYLLEADAAVNTHKDSIETEFSHRTRVLDHLLTCLPTVTTEGDYLADEVISLKQLGASAPAYDAQAVADAILEVVDPKNNEVIRRRIAAERKQFDWEATLAPLKEFLLADHPRLPQTERRHEIPKDGKAVAMAKRVLPVGVKKMIIRATRYSS